MSALHDLPPGFSLTPDEPAATQEAFIECLMRAGRIVRQGFSNELNARGHTYPPEVYPTIRYLYEHGVKHQDQIASFLVRDKATVARMLLRLEGSGLVTRATDPTNRRRKLVNLTAHGRDTVHELTQSARRIRSSATHGITATELRVCNDILARVLQNMSLAPEPTPGDRSH